MDLILLFIIVVIVTAVCGIIWHYATKPKTSPPKTKKSGFEIWKEDVKEYLYRDGRDYVYPKEELTNITAYQRGVRPEDYADSILRRYH